MSSRPSFFALCVLSVVPAFSQSAPDAPPTSPRVNPAIASQLTIAPDKVEGLVPPVSPGVGRFLVGAVGADLCLGYRPGGGARVPFLALSRCGVGRSEASPEGMSALVVVPHPRGGFTLRSPRPYDARDMGGQQGESRMFSCVTVARGVIVGPPGIDIVACDAPSGETDDSGGADQRFHFVEATVRRTGRLSDRYFSIVSEASPGKCLDVRGGSGEIDTDLILWDCNNQSNQLFHFRFLEGLDTVAEVRIANSLGYTAPDLHSMFLRAVPVSGYDLPGHDLMPGFETADDGGTACARSCAANEDCRAFTWVKPGTQGAGARCWLKTRYGNAITNAGTASGIVRAASR